MFPKKIFVGILVIAAFLCTQCHNHPTEASTKIPTIAKEATEVAATVKEEAAETAVKAKEAGEKVLAEAKPTLTAVKEEVKETANVVAEKTKEVAATVKEEVKEKVVEVKEKVEPVKKKAAPKPKPKPKKRSKIAFKETVHEYGTIKQGEVVKHDFKFTNTGNAPLVIKKVDASCGCTFPSYPFIPIEPGEEGTIGVTFNSAGKIGPQKPTITVVTNGRPSTLKLNLDGFVE